MLNLVITGSRIQLFELLSQNKTEIKQECHFVWNPSTTRCYTPQTRHVAIKRYIAGVLKHGPILLVTRCAYCRANYTYSCFLCLEDITQNQQNLKTTYHHTWRMRARPQIHTLNVVWWFLPGMQTMCGCIKTNIQEIISDIEQTF